MSLAHVALGDPHLKAHNDERDAINTAMSSFVEGGAWVPGATSAAGTIWTYSGQRWVDLTGVSILPTSPATPRFVFTGMDSSGISSSELVYSENVTGTQSTVSTSGFTDVTGVSGVIPVTTKPVRLSVGAGVIVTTPPTSGRAFVYIVMLDATTGAYLCTAGTEIPPGSSGDSIPIYNERRLPPITAAKTVKLQAFQFSTGATGTPVTKLDNGNSFSATPPVPYPSFLSVMTS